MKILTGILFFSAVFLGYGPAKADGIVYNCKSWNLEHDSFLDLTVYSQNGALSGTITDGTPTPPIRYGVVLRTVLTPSDLAKMNVQSPEAVMAYGYTVLSPLFTWIQIFSNGKETKAVYALGTILRCE